MRITSPPLCSVLLQLPLVASLWLLSAAVHADALRAPGWGKLDYTLPAAGSYALPPLGNAANGNVLDESGTPRKLHDVLGGARYTLLNFMYSNCSDANGCPLASYVFYRIKSMMQENSTIADNLQLISLSFDPARDTPEVMKLYGRNFEYAGDKGRWHFLTTHGETELQPLLRDYKQDIQRTIAVSGNAETDYAHQLRVYLIDTEKQIRNIYSVGYLHADVLLNDLETLMLEDGSTPQPDTGTTLLASSSGTSSLSRPGDGKIGYDDATYTTDSQSVPDRNHLGTPADLLAIAQNPPLGLPALHPDILDSLSGEKIALGRKLFYDRRLSLNDTFSCAMCHIPEQGFTSNEMKTAVGVEGRSVRRNSPSIFNVGLLNVLFHDGREFDLDNQIWAPLLARNEMANPSIGYVVNKVRQMQDYGGLFEGVYGQTVTMATLGDALAAYQRSLLSADSRFDRWHFGQDTDALSEQEQTGFRLFTGKARCIVCHTINADHALLTDQQLHNTGVGYRETMGISSGKTRVALAPGVFVEVEQSIIDQVSEPPPRDLGLYEITQNPADRWKYRTPGLRNVALTAPYMHNGSLRTLRDVVEFYNDGGIDNPELSPLIKPLHLTQDDIDALVSFLNSLTGSNVDELVADAFAAPVGDPFDKPPLWANQPDQTRAGERR